MVVELRKGQEVSLEKCGAPIGEILINLNWSQSVKGSLFSKVPQPIDLDLGCVYKLKNGIKDAAQAFGNGFDSFT